MSVPSEAAIAAAERIYANRMSGKREIAKELFAFEIQKAIDSENTLEKLTEKIRLILPTLTDQQRTDAFYAIMDGYCQSCGRDDSGTRMGCQCWNDE